MATGSDKSRHYQGYDAKTDRLVRSWGDDRQELARRVFHDGGHRTHFRPDAPPAAWLLFHMLGENQRAQPRNRPVPRHANHHGGVGAGAERDVRNVYGY